MNSFETCLKSLDASWEGPLMNARDLVDDTREVKDGDFFVLRQGANPLRPEQEKMLCENAAKAGAVAIIGNPSIPVTLPLIRLENVHTRLGMLAEAFYGAPSKEMKVIAVTGTNGKTTTTYLIESLASAMGLKVGVLGTISYRYPGFEEPAPNTTPGTLRLYRLMRAMANAKCDLVAMEVSSHGIVQGRIDGLLFDAAIWNNLGTDHLDFHKTREAYGLAKRRLFDHDLVRSFRAGKSPVAIPNARDPEVMALIQSANPDAWGGRVISFSTGPESANLQFTNIHWENDAWQLEIRDENQKIYPSSLPLIGAYNLDNAAGAVSAMHALDYSLDRIAQALSHVQQIPGRMERITCPNATPHPTMIVDFAHTPEAFENALKAARKCVPNGGRLIAVFGAGGDRDPSKRPLMGAAVADFADASFVTSDNPRTEDPRQIIDQILTGMSANHTHFVQPDRKNAILEAFAFANDRDVILILGKGHENYQIIGTEKHHFDDREICRECLRR